MGSSSGVGNIILLIDSLNIDADDINEDNGGEEAVEEAVEEEEVKKAGDKEEGGVALHRLSIALSIGTIICVCLSNGRSDLLVEGSDTAINCNFSSRSLHRLVQQVVLLTCLETLLLLIPVALVVEAA